MNYFANLIGQERAVELLQQAVEQKRISPAYLFYGASGIGKSIAAYNWAQLLLCQGLSASKHKRLIQKLQTGNHPDVLWVEPTYLDRGELVTFREAEHKGLKRKTPPQIRIEQIREITNFLTRLPLEASRLVVVIKEAQTMPEAAANALLKTLEEPGKATIILIADDTSALLPTIISRCQSIPFARLSKSSLEKVLQQQGYSEILQQPEIMAIAQGSPGVAISAWQKLAIVPVDLRHKLQQKLQHPLEAIELAKKIYQELDLETQLWLVDYLQYYYWQQLSQTDIVEQWENTRQYLRSFVQPRLVWESTLLKLVFL